MRLFKILVNFYKKTLKINPAHLESMINLANCYEDINELDKAVKVLDKVCKLYPDKYEVHFSLARLCHIKKKDFDKAYNAYKKTLSINNNFKFALLQSLISFSKFGFFNKFVYI